LYTPVLHRRGYSVPFVFFFDPADFSPSKLQIGWSLHDATMTQMTQDDAKQMGLRHAENPGNTGFFCTSMTQ
jgi:hypothetical protein